MDPKMWILDLYANCTNSPFCFAHTPCLGSPLPMSANSFSFIPFCHRTFLLSLRYQLVQSKCNRNRSLSHHYWSLSHLVFSSVHIGGHHLLPLPCLPKSWNKCAVLPHVAHILITILSHVLCTAFIPSLFINTILLQASNITPINGPSLPSLNFLCPTPHLGLPLPCVWPALHRHTFTLPRPLLDTFGGSLSQHTEG